MSPRMIVEVSTGHRVLFGSTGTEAALSEAAFGEHVPHVTKDRFAAALGGLTALLETLQHSVEQMPKRPEQVELAFSASVTSMGDLWIVSGDAAAEFKVTLSWGKAD